MAIPDALSLLVERDGLREVSEGLFGSGPVWVHNDHRFVLPLAHWAQVKGLLPRPCRLVTLDVHTDDVPPRKDGAREEIARVRAAGIDMPEMIGLTDYRLSELDDDWIVAGMELGMFSDAVIFGASAGGQGHGLVKFSDHTGQPHRIYRSHSLPGEAFGFQGDLSDGARSEELEPLWDILGWRAVDGRFELTHREPLLLSIDLDAFAMRWEDFTFAWRPEVWERRFLEPSDYFTTTGWTGKDFVRELLSFSGVVAIAREPSHCGGEDEAAQILEDLNEIVFDGNLRQTDR